MGWLSSRYRNIRVLLLILCCLPVIAGFCIIWKSTWGHKPVAPVVGYSILGFFGPVVGLTISLGASNVAGETKKSFTASAVFVAYCVGNIIGPQLIQSQTKSQHYPELWTGLIIWYVSKTLFIFKYTFADFDQAIVLPYYLVRVFISCGLVRISGGMGWNRMRLTVIDPRSRISLIRKTCISDMCTRLYVFLML